MIRVDNQVEVIEYDGERMKVGEAKHIKVTSHWNQPNLVVIVGLGGERITVLADDIEAAIKNAKNTNRF